MKSKEELAKLFCKNSIKSHVDMGFARDNVKTYVLELLKYLDAEDMEWAMSRLKQVNYYAELAMQFHAEAETWRIASEIINANCEDENGISDAFDLLDKLDECFPQT